MKKVLVCALAALFLMATCLTAFAVDYTTTTTYVDNKLEIKTTATGTEQGEMLTYLAYTDEDPTDETIVYIDQQTFDGSTPVVFSYTSDDVETIADLSKIIVKSGSSKLDKANTLTEETRNAYRTINVVVRYEDEDENATVTFPKDYAESTLNLVNTGLTIKEGYTFDDENTDDSISVDDSGNISITDKDYLENGSTVDVIVTKVDTWKPSVDDDKTKAGRYEGYTEEGSAEKLTIFGIVDPDTTVADWGGIILAKNEEDLRTENVNRRVYQAKHRSDDGQFAVQLVNHGSPELMDDWYACIYVKDADGKFIYGDTIFDFLNSAE